MDQIRTFLAVNFGSFYARFLSRLIRMLNAPDFKVKWTDPAQVHLTLNFFGSISVEVIGQITERLSNAFEIQNPFELYLKGLGGFPDVKRPRVLWVGIDGDINELKSVKEVVDKKLADLPVPQEKRPFKPHLTLGRFREIPKKSLLLPPATEQVWDSSPFLVSEIVLFRSDLTPEGALYTPLQSFRFHEKKA